MFKAKLCIAFLACLLLFAVNAKADSFTLTAIGSGIDISATLTGTATGTPGVFDITGMTGTVNGYSATLLPSSGPGAIMTTSVVDGWEILYNNVLYMNSTSFFDYYGLGFTANGALENLYFSRAEICTRNWAPIHRLTSQSRSTWFKLPNPAASCCFFLGCSP